MQIQTFVDNDKATSELIRELHVTRTKSQRTDGHIRSLWPNKQPPPWLNTLSTGADVHGAQKVLSNNGFRMANCLLPVTRCHGVPCSLQWWIRCTKV